MKTLIVEDDFVSRMVMVKQFASFGGADVAVNGKEAVQAVEMQIALNEPYDLICLDIMMPEMNGQDALKKIREAEKRAGIAGLDRAKIIMTTALGGSDDILTAFRDECDGYLVKPIKKQELLKLLDMLELKTGG